MFFVLGALCAALASPPAIAAEKANAPAGGTPATLPRPDFHFPGSVGRTYLDSDPPQLDVGMDVGSAVDFTYKPPFRFTGTIEKVAIELK
jgi:hypothetical protein